MNNIVLSICIPTFNSGQYLYDILLKFLQVKDNRFEIVISDNCSTDNSFEILSNIKDNRISVFQNSQNTGSYENGLRVLSRGKGKYLLFLTDKDCILSDNITKVLDILENNDFEVGYSILNCRNRNLIVKNLNGIKTCLKNLSYGTRHPSGFIFNKKLFDEKNIAKKYIQAENIIKSYMVDFITADLFENYRGLIIKGAFIEINNPPYQGLEHSLTYSPEKNNLFFIPKNRLKVMQSFIQHLKSKGLRLSDRVYLTSKIIINTYCQCTSVYKRILNDIKMTEWYNLSKDFIQTEKNKDYDKYFCGQITNNICEKISLENVLILINFAVFYMQNKIKIRLKKVYKNHVQI